jgi:hypothetical protein
VEKSRLPNERAEDPELQRFWDMKKTRLAVEGQREQRWGPDKPLWIADKQDKGRTQSDQALINAEQTLLERIRVPITAFIAAGEERVQFYDAITNYTGREHMWAIHQANVLQQPGDPNLEVNRVELTPRPKLGNLFKASGKMGPHVEDAGDDETVVSAYKAGVAEQESSIQNAEKALMTAKGMKTRERKGNSAPAAPSVDGTFVNVRNTGVKFTPNPYPMPPVFRPLPLYPPFSLHGQVPYALHSSPPPSRSPLMGMYPGYHRQQPSSSGVTYGNVFLSPLSNLSKSNTGKGDYMEREPSFRQTLNRVNPTFTIF